MPTAAPKICSKPGCYKLTNQGRCEDHKVMHNWHHTKSRHERGYGHKWDKLRAHILKRDHYLCQPCLRAGKATTATQVDHIKPKAQVGGDEPGNLQAICTACHKRKTAQESNGVHTHQGRDANGNPLDPDHHWNK